MILVGVGWLAIASRNTNIDSFPWWVILIIVVAAVATFLLRRYIGRGGR